MKETAQFVIIVIIIIIIIDFMFRMTAGSIFGQVLSMNEAELAETLHHLCSGPMDIKYYSIRRLDMTQGGELGLMIDG